MKYAFKTAVIYVLGIFFIILGIGGLVLPFLQGILFITIGVLLLALRVPGGGRLLSWVAKTHPKVAGVVQKVEHWADGQKLENTVSSTQKQKEREAKDKNVEQKVCDNTSVGILVFNKNRLLLIDRKNPPFGLAPPAGHVDEHGEGADSEEEQFRAAAVEELDEETGLEAVSLNLIAEDRKENPCRRRGGSWHYWRVYTADTVGELSPSKEETKGHVWCTKKHMKELLQGGSLMVPAHGKARKLEPVWLDWFEDVDILSCFPPARKQ